MKKSKKMLATAMVASAFVMQGAVSNAQNDSSAKPASDESIRPFKVHIPQSDLDDLRRRILATKWPDRETVTDESQGVQLATMQKLAKYWATDYDWRKVEARLNALPQFITTIDGVDIHFIHVRSKYPNALPIIITHGWPGSVIEQLKIIGPLTDPVAYGGKAEDAFDVVIPSLPGHGFSGKPTTTGWEPVHIAKAWIELMRRFGYKKYVAQGGDWGNAVTETYGIDSASGISLASIPTCLPLFRQKFQKRWQQVQCPPDLSADEKNAYQQLDFFYKKGLGYANEMSLTSANALWNW